MSSQTSSLTFSAGPDNNMLVSLLEYPRSTVYRVQTKKEGSTKITSLYRLLEDGSSQPVGQIELHTLGSDLVHSHNGQDIRPGAASGLGFGSGKEFQATDGLTYTWRWKKLVGWVLWDSLNREVASLNCELKRLNFAQSVQPDLQADIVLTVIYLEQRRWPDPKTKNAIKANSQSSGPMMSMLFFT